MKKRLQLFVLALATTMAGFAQIDARYGVGAVPVVNNRVTFEKTLSIPDGLNEKWAYAKALKWVENRFVVPTVLSSKIVEQDETNYHLVIQAEEYLTFKRNWIVLDRTRINYLRTTAGMPHVATTTTNSQNGRTTDASPPPGSPINWRKEPS